MTQEILLNKFENHCINQGLTKSRVRKLKCMWKTIERGLAKPFEDVTREDMEKFMIALNNDTFTKITGKPLSGSTKADLKKTIRQIWKWFKGNNESFPEEVSWIGTRIAKDQKPKEKPIISLDEVKQLAMSFKKLEYRIAVLILFDSGFRIGELFSVKKENIYWELYDDENKCFWIECTESKTECRKIPIPLFTDDIQSFLNSTYFTNMNKDDKVFNFDYDDFRLALRYNSKKLFNKLLTPHCLRHSSVTHYATACEGNLTLIAERYGWSYSAKELRTYVKRSGASQRLSARKIFSNETIILKKKLAYMEDAVESTTSQINEQREIMKSMQKQLAEQREWQERVILELQKKATN